MTPIVKTASLTIAFVVALPLSNAFAAPEPASATDGITCVPIPPVEYQGQTIFPGTKVCVPTP
jgi:hypothetical protein